MDDEDFKVQLVINNLDSVLADTGAKVSVCSYEQARKWNLRYKMTSTKMKIKQKIMLRTILNRKKPLET